MHNQMSHKTTNNTTPTQATKSQNNTKEKIDICENHLFILEERGKKMQMNDSKSKNGLKPSQKEKENLERKWSFSHVHITYFVVIFNKFQFSSTQHFKKNY